jgi:hypothetical protein
MCNKSINNLAGRANGNSRPRNVSVEDNIKTDFKEIAFGDVA